MHVDAFRNAIRPIRRIARNRLRSLEAITRTFSETVFRSWFNDCWFDCMNYYVAFMERNLCAGWMNCRKMAFSIEEQLQILRYSTNACAMLERKLFIEFYAVFTGALASEIACFFSSFFFFFYITLFSLSPSLSFVRSFINNKCVSLKDIVLTK